MAGAAARGGAARRKLANATVVCGVQPDEMLPVARRGQLNHAEHL